jgi:hypothetical protein
MMAKFAVLRPIEHNQVLYAPKGGTGEVKTKSAGHGGEISVDASGTIDLDATAAEAFTGGQVAPLPGPSVEAQSAKRPKR